VIPESIADEDKEGLLNKSKKTDIPPWIVSPELIAEKVSDLSPPLKKLHEELLECLQSGDSTRLETICYERRKDILSILSTEALRDIKFEKNDILMPPNGLLLMALIETLTFIPQPFTLLNILCSHFMIFEAPTPFFTSLKSVIKKTRDLSNLNVILRSLAVIVESRDPSEHSQDFISHLESDDDTEYDRQLKKVEIEKRLAEFKNNNRRIIITKRKLLNFLFRLLTYKETCYNSLFIIWNISFAFKKITIDSDLNSTINNIFENILCVLDTEFLDISCFRLILMTILNIYSIKKDQFFVDGCNLTTLNVFFKSFTLNIFFRNSPIVQLEKIDDADKLNEEFKYLNDFIKKIQTITKELIDSSLNVTTYLCEIFSGKVANTPAHTSEDFWMKNINDMFKNKYDLFSAYDHYLSAAIQGSINTDSTTNSSPTTPFVKKSKSVSHKRAVIILKDIQNFFNHCNDEDRMVLIDLINLLNIKQNLVLLSNSSDNDVRFESGKLLTFCVGVEWFNKKS